MITSTDCKQRRRYIVGQEISEVQRTDVDNSEHVKAGREAAADADQCVVKYLPSSDHSQLPKRLVHFHLSL